MYFQTTARKTSKDDSKVKRMNFDKSKTWV